MGDLDPHVKHRWFVRSTRVLNPHGISIGAAIFAGLTSETDQPTDHATQSVTVARFYLVLRCNLIKSLTHKQQELRLVTEMF